MHILTLILIYSLTVLFLFYDVIILSNTFASGDSFNPYAIHHILDKIRLSSLEWPQWQPWIFSGMPTLEAFTYVNLLYLPSFFLNLLGTSDLNIQFIHLVVSGIGMVFLIRRLIDNEQIAFVSGLPLCFRLTYYILVSQKLETITSTCNFRKKSNLGGISIKQSSD